MGQLLPGIANHVLRHACQFCDLQTITLAGRAVMNVVQEHNGVVVLRGSQVNVDGVLKIVGQLRKLEIVSGKQGFTSQSRVIVDIFQEKL